MVEYKGRHGGGVMPGSVNKPTLQILGAAIDDSLKFVGLIFQKAIEKSLGDLIGFLGGFLPEGVQTSALANPKGGGGNGGTGVGRPEKKEHSRGEDEDNGEVG